jgi:putative ABC transport system substrate-binding protein
MRRRDIITHFGGTAATWPLAARAQPLGKTYRIAIVTRTGTGSDLEAASHGSWQAWRDELQRLGYVEGQNLMVVRRSVGTDTAQIDMFVREVVRLKPDAIFSPAQNLVEALKTATATIPIVAIAADPVGAGLAATLARPGGNVTGFSVDAGVELIGKRFVLLKEAVPTIARLAFLIPCVNWEGRWGGIGQDAARLAGIQIIAALIESPANEMEYRRVFAAMVRDGADSFYAAVALENLTYRRPIAELAAEARLPAIYAFRENVEVGGLMSYGIDLADIFRRAAGYTDRILKGANPAEMPFQQPTNFELVINLTTAKALGLTIPPSILARADEVIE